MAATGRKSQRGTFTQGLIPDSVEIVTRLTAVTGHREVRRNFKGRLSGIGCVRNKPQRATEGTRTIQCALRAAQDLNPVHVSHLEIGEYRDVAEIGRYSRLGQKRRIGGAGLGGRIQAADNDVVVIIGNAWPLLQVSDAGNHTDKVRKILDAVTLDILTGNRRNGVRRIEDTDFSAGRSDNYLFEDVAASHLIHQLAFLC